jgi:hypothetical protein
MYHNTHTYTLAGRTNINIEPVTDTEAEDNGDETVPRRKKKAKKVVNVGLGRRTATEWRRVWRDIIITRMVEFQPDLIIVSAGFDAHKRDGINHGFVGIAENDYAWVTSLIVQAANKCCNGRLVSMLEGGYQIDGGPVSPFARSVAAHVQAMNTESSMQWDQQLIDADRDREWKEAIELAQAARERLMQQQIEGASADPTAEGQGRRRPRRSVAPVDYQKLNKEYEEEMRAAKKRKLEGESTEAGAAALDTAAAAAQE